MKLSHIGLSITNWIQKRRYYYIVFFVIAALLIVEIARLFLLSGVESDWETIREEQALKESQAIQTKFAEIQERVYRITERVAAHLTEIDNEDIQSICFNILESFQLDELQGVEVYSPDGSLIAWWGRIPEDVLSRLNRRDINSPFSIIKQGTVFTTSSVINPVRDANNNSKAIVLAHEAFDVQYVLSPRFVRMQGLQRDLRESLGKPVQLLFDSDVTAEGQLLVPLHGLDDTLLGYARIPPPTLEGYVGDLENAIHQVRSFLIIILTIIGFFGLINWLRRLQFPLYSLLLSLLIIWGVRYVWMFLDIPGSFIGGAAFDPAYYASPHGGGIVASAGDFLITVLFFIFTGLLLFHSIVVNNSLRLPNYVSGVNRVLTIIGSLFVMLIFMGLIRSYGASVRSLVFDSSIRFTDPGSLFPSPMLALMQLNLLTLTIAFVLLGTVLGYISLRLLQSGFHRSILQSSIVLFIIIMSAAIGYYYPQNNPLVPVWYYAGVPIVLIGITLLVQNGFLQSFRLYKIRSVLFLTGISVLFAAPVLDRKIHEFDREQIQFIADTIVRPADAWTEFVLNESLREFSNDPELIRLMESESHDAMDQKAFHLWAGSMLGREGYNTTLLILDNNDELVGRFAIGFQPVLNDTPFDLPARYVSERETHIQDIETIYGNATLYMADAGILNVDNEFLGTVVVKLITGPGTLFRGYGPDILQTHISPDISARYGQLIISEFEGTELISTSAVNIPTTHTIPEEVIRKLQQEESFVWQREYFDDQLYETAYFHDPNGGSDSFLAISIPYLDFRWHIFYALKLIFFALAVSGVLLLIAGVVFYAQGKRYQPTFREKILIGMLSLSLIPIIIVAYLNRDFTIDRMTEDTSRHLLDEAKRVALQIDRLFEENTDVYTISQSAAERVATDLGIDFVIYTDGYMHATSRMEMFEAELMDNRLSGFAYLNIVMHRKNFVTREEAIGQSSYLVGYRPLYDDANDLWGVLAIPAIYRQAEIDEELARRDAFLFGVYAVVMLGVIITGLIVANRFARPIETLTDATYKVAGGELDIHLDARGESEISNLMRSFNVMTKRLAKSREELARVERELAWREMARQVAHEIKNPLTPMKLSIQQLRQTRKDRSSDFDQAFDTITNMLLEQINTLDKIASEFSRFARMPVAQFEEVNVNEILQRALTIFPDKNGVDFQIKFDDTISTIEADPEELQRAFINIIRNSIQAMPDGGTLEVSTKFRNGKIFITISDTGAGIPPAVRARLFEPNFSTKTDGMGLGLALVKKTIDELNGTIKIESEENVGTTVSITLPVNKTPGQRSGKEQL